MKKYVALIMGLVAILPMAGATDFELSVNDAKGDVSNADIDIIKAWTSVDGNNIIFHIQVAGKINDKYAYWVTMWNGEEELGAVYTNGQAFYTGGTSGGFAQYEVNGNTLLIYVPKGTFSGWQHFSFQAFAGKTYQMGEYDFTAEVGDAGSDGGGNGNGNEESKEDPANEKPTDETIKVKITDVKYSYKEEGNKIEIYMNVKGTTNGVDHVWLGYTIYYKDGTHEFGGWTEPMKEYNFNYGDYHMSMFFNSTSGQWNTWELRINGTAPKTSYEWVENASEKKVDKIVIYARAFKDKEGTKWNQCKYETTPKMLENGVSYAWNNGKESESSESKKKTPGFELGFALVSLAAIAMSIKRRKR